MSILSQVILFVKSTLMTLVEESTSEFATAEEPTTTIEPESTTAIGKFKNFG